MKKRIIILGRANFPSGDACSVRIAGLGFAMRDAGYQVLVLCSDLSMPDNVEGGDASRSYEGLSYLRPSTMPHPTHKGAQFLSYFTGQPFMEWLSHSDLTNVAAIISYHGSAWLLQRMRCFSRARDIPFLTDCTEWYDSHHATLGPWGPFRWDNEARMRWLLPRIPRQFVISSFLQHYLSQFGCQTLVVPTLLDTRCVPARLDVTESSRLILAYTGVPGKKDLLDPILETLLQRDPNGQRVIFRIAGPQRDWILNSPALRTRGLTTLPDCLDLRDRMPHEQALDLVRQADYSVLLRPEQRFAQAGFPTKVAESLTVGTPVICNLTSDLGMYVHDGVEGFVCTEPTVSQFALALGRALALSPEQRQAMRRAARRCGETSFDYRTFVSPIRTFLQESHS